MPRPMTVQLSQENISGSFSMKEKTDRLEEENDYLSSEVKRLT